MTEEIPLIHTSKGNLPIADLEYKVQWSMSDDNVIWVGEHFYNGESVRREVHILNLKGYDFSGSTGQPTLEVENG